MSDVILIVGMLFIGWMAGMATMDKKWTEKVDSGECVCAPIDESTTAANNQQDGD